MKLIHRRHFVVGNWALNEIVSEWGRILDPVFSFIDGPISEPVFGRICYRNSENADQLVDMVGDNTFLTHMSENTFSDDQRAAFSTLCETMLTPRFRQEATPIQ